MIAAAERATRTTFSNSASDIPTFPVRQDEQQNFTDFASRHEYQAVVRELVEQLFDRLPNNFLHVDIATGTGLVPSILAELCERTGKSGTIICIEPEEYALEHAKNTVPSTERCAIIYEQGFGQQTLDIVGRYAPEGTVDSAGIFDAIHEIPGKDQKMIVLAQAAKLLKPGGLFVMNSAFTTEATATREARKGWIAWIGDTMRLLKAQFNIDKDSKDPNLEQFKVKTHTPDEYIEMLSDVGLVDVTPIGSRAREVALTTEALRNIASYPRFVLGSTELDRTKVPLEAQIKAMHAAIEGVESLSRTWINFIAEKQVILRDAIPRRVVEIA